MDFVENLKLLCTHYSSIAEVCRKIGINRTQFNKYLNAQVHPSKSNIRIICDFFGVEEFEIMMPHDQFRQQVLPSKSDPSQENDLSAFFEKAKLLKSASSATLTRYLGWYYEYYFSLGYPGQVFQSLIEIRQDATGLTYKRYERLINNGQSHEKVTHCLYDGIAINLCDRIFLLDVESLTENEITQTILFPSYRSQIKHLHGLKLGVSSRSHRSPACTRVLYDFIGKKINFRQAFRECGLYQKEEIDTAILDAINNDKNPEDPLFFARGE